MYTGKVFLTNKRRTPFSLSNDFDDTFGLTDEIERCKSTKELCRIVNHYHRTSVQWKISNDNEKETRLEKTDRLGNVSYLIVYKKEKEQKTEGIGSELKKKILDTVIWYAQADDENNISLAREHGEVLCELLKEIIAQ